MSVALALAILAAATAAAADAGSVEPEAEDGEVGERRPVVLAHLESTPAEAAAEVEAAVRAQLVGLDARLLVDRVPDHGGDIPTKIAAAHALAREHDALGVFWVEPVDDAELLLYLVDRHGKALLRRVRRDPEGVGAESESVAVIVRASTVALLEGRSIGMELVETEEQKPEPPPPPPPKRQAPVVERDQPPQATILGYPYFGLDVGYAGTSLAARSGAAWQNGLLLRASAYPTRGPWYLGVGYTFYQSFTTTEAFADADTQFELLATVIRRPLQAFTGYQYARRAFLLDAEAAVVVDLASLRATEQDREATLQSSTELRTMIGIEPRLRFHWVPNPQVSLSLAVGAEIMALNEQFDFSWKTEDGELRERRTYLDPFPVRPTVGAGVAVWLPVREAVVKTKRRRRRSRAPRRR